MTKAELRQKYRQLRDEFEADDGTYTNEYALGLDTLLSRYLNEPLARWREEETDET